MHASCLFQDSIQPAFSSSVWFLPKQISSPFLLFQIKTVLPAPDSPFYDSTAHQEQRPAIPALRFPRKSHKLLLKGLWKVNGKRSVPSAGLKLLLWGLHCHWTTSHFFLQGVYRTRQKGGNYRHKYMPLKAKHILWDSFLCLMELHGPDWLWVAGISQNLCLPFRSYLAILQMCLHMGWGWAGETETAVWLGGQGHKSNVFSVHVKTFQ